MSRKNLPQQENKCTANWTKKLLKTFEVLNFVIKVAMSH